MAGNPTPPGPWTVLMKPTGQEGGTPPVPRVMAGGRQVAKVRRCRRGQGGLEAEAAIARLIAAAPCLLSALERLLEERNPFASDADSCECGENGSGYDDAGNPCEHIQACRAIARAKKGGD